MEKEFRFVHPGDGVVLVGVRPLLVLADLELVLDKEAFLHLTHGPLACSQREFENIVV